MAKIGIEISTDGFLKVMGLSSRLGLPAKEILGVALEMALRSLDDVEMMVSNSRKSA
jgi:hypothetical protein